MPEITPAVMHAPIHPRYDNATGQRKYSRPYRLVFVCLRIVGDALHQSRKAEGKEQMVFVDEVERNGRKPRSQIKRAGSKIPQCFHGNPKSNVCAGIVVFLLVRRMDWQAQEGY